MDERTRMINDLKKQAEKVKKLKESHRKRRPIVIEFSGSPKAGKTSCINSLRQFLKRNGFEVEVIQERASSCPVSDKRSPMFNVWTACASVTGLIGIIEDKRSTCDVIILDRGIFDAICWFEWLSTHGKMDCDFREKCQNFFLSNELVGMIDVVFSFTVEPQKSIEREFAAVLTEQIGSIMNPVVLKQYKEAINVCVKYKKKCFGSVISIDTTTQTQDEVGFQVTKKTLEELEELLDEKIAFFKADKLLKKQMKKQPIGLLDSIEKYTKGINFEKRSEVEKVKAYLQPIPILVLTDMSEQRVLVVKKKKEALSGISTMNGISTEANKILLYVGGHIRQEDVRKGKNVDFMQICRDALKREVKEELGISVVLADLEPYYIWATGENEGQHLAICFQYKIETEGLKLYMDEHELVQSKGQSISGKFMTIQEILNQKNELEPWSVVILKVSAKYSYANHQIRSHLYQDRKSVV